MQIENRCPWCGEVYGEKSKVPSGRRFIISCEHCGRMAKEKVFSFRVTIVIVIMMIVFAIMITRWRLPSWLLCIWGLLFSLIGSFAMMLLRMPRHRYCEVYEKAPLNELSLCEAKINWYSSDKGGFRFPWIRIYSGVLFPICFVDENDIPISQMGVVRLVKRYGLFWKGAEVFLIMDFIKPEAIEEGQKFYIFNEKKRIGEGIVSYK